MTCSRNNSRISSMVNLRDFTYSSLLIVEWGGVTPGDIRQPRLESPWMSATVAANYRNARSDISEMAGGDFPNWVVVP